MDNSLNKSRFLTSIDKYAKKKCLKLTEEIQQIEKEKLLKEEVKIVEQARSLMMSELNDVKKKISIKIYKERMDSHRRILNRRLEIENEIFNLCKLQLEKFTSSNKYFDWLKESLNYALKNFGEKFDVFFCNKDIHHMDKLKKSFPSALFLESVKIKHGGLILRNGNVILDDSFDYRLSNQHKFFSEKFACNLV